jgi:hypothetical protein
VLYSYKAIMFCKTGVVKVAAVLGLIWTAGVCSVSGADVKTLPGHVPAVVSKLQALGDLPATNELWLAIGLPLRDPAGLKNFLADVYNPASPNYRHYLTPDQFTAKFGPTERDYAAVKAFARANGFIIAGEHGNRLILDVRAKAADIQRAFHLHLRRFQHPSEAREFFAPDVEPTVDATLPVADVSGLSNYQRPQPKRLKKNSMTGQAAAKAGSAPTGDFLGDDFRAAYVPDTTLTGAGQVVGLLQFDNYYSNDITAYATLAGGGRTNIPIQTVLLGGYGGRRGSGNGEVALDIQMAMAMAPGLAKIIIFTGGPTGSQNDILNAMAASNTVKNLSCSWGWGGGPDATTDAIFQQMASQGQSFFNASGDSDAFTTGASSVNGVDRISLANAPSSSPYITQVGGTTLTMTGAGGAWQSETVWNWGSGSGSSGGISSYYSIPDWQAGVSMANNQGSTVNRNLPDVALTADNVYSYSDNGTAGSVGGTSCAAPLWAGLTALANQLASQAGKPSVGLINQAVYAIGASGGYAQDFHDITTGDNTWSSSPAQFYATNGYDLCTGWGTPAGQSLLNELAGVGAGDPLVIVSNVQLNAVGPVGGPFRPANFNLTLTNASAASLAWAWLSSNAVPWLTVSAAGGSLAAHKATNVQVGFTLAATNLALGNYATTLKFTNQTSGLVQSVSLKLQVVPALSVQPAGGFSPNGPAGGPMAPASQNFTIVNLGGNSAAWKVVLTNTWLMASQTNGVVAAAGQTNFTLSLTAAVNAFAAGFYKAMVLVKDGNDQVIQALPVVLNVGQNLVTNGGFETGDFTGWTLNASSTKVAKTLGLVHSGKYSANLGQSKTLGWLSQTLATSAGQTYQISLWLRNKKNNRGATPNEFQVQWEGMTLFDRVNIPYGAWTNLQFTVTATNSGSLLRLGFRDDPYYLGLDDVSVKPVVAPHLRAIVQNPNPAAFHFDFTVSSGSVYQAQYKTNLLQPDWIDLGTTNTAASDAFTLTDTNTAPFAQKFYRLILIQ